MTTPRETLLGKREDRITDFKKRAETEKIFCEELFRDATIRLLAFKYAYYILAEEIVKDVTYDGEEDTWFVMGRALGKLKEDETSPCVGFNENHELAKEAIVLANRLLRKK